MHPLGRRLQGHEGPRHPRGRAGREGCAQFKPIYDDSLSLWDKVKTIAREIYRADDIVADKSVRDQLKGWEAQGYGKFPICMAKTQYSFTTDPNLKARPSTTWCRSARCASRRCGIHRRHLR